MTRILKRPVRVSGMCWIEWLRMKAIIEALMGRLQRPITSGFQLGTYPDQPGPAFWRDAYSDILLPQLVKILQ